MIVLCDSQKPANHPWERYLPPGWSLERAALETGDLALASLPEGAVAERKTASAMASCVGSNRERFTRELRRGRYIGRMASWTHQYCPFILAGDQRLAAAFSWRFLCSQLGGLAKAQRVQPVPTRKPITPAVEQDDEGYRPSEL